MRVIRTWLALGAICCSNAAFGQATLAPAPTVLTTAESVQRLSREEGQRYPPVRLRGIVSFSHQAGRTIFVQDETGGIFCDPRTTSPLPETGRRVEIVGVASDGAFLPFVIAQEVKDLGPGTLPPARPVRAAQLVKGAYDADFIRFSGYVAEAVLRTNISEPRLNLRLASSGPDMDVRVFGVRDLQVDQLPGAFVEVDGVFAPTVANQKLTQATIWAGRPEMFRVITNAADVVAGLAISPIKALLASDPNSEPGLVRIRGVVNMAAHDDFWLGDGNNGIDVWAHKGPRINRGEIVDLVGFVRVTGQERTLSLTHVLSRCKGSPHAGTPVTARDLVDTRRYGEVVRIEGEFLHRVPDKIGDILVMRAGDLGFEARVSYPAGPEIATLAGGSRLQISGILRVLPPEQGAQQPPRILVPAANGIRVVDPAPWPMRHTLLVVTSLALALSLGLGALALAHLRLRISQKGRAAAEAKLHKLNLELEERIRSRTTELETANARLAVDIANREQAETALKESEERLRTVVETLQEMVWVGEPGNPRPLYVSPVFEKIWGRPVREVMENPAAAMETVHPEDRARFSEVLRRQAAGEQTSIEYRICRPDGTVRWIWDQGFPVKDAQGEVVRVHGIASDVTERRLLEQQLRQAQKMEAIGTLAGGIAHDFNNILGAILGNAELAMMDLERNHPAAEALAEIKQAGNRAKSLVLQILAFSRQQPSQRRVIPLGPVVEEVVSLLRATLPAGVQLVRTIQPDAPTVLADATQIHQVLLNLCTNSWHALNDHHGRIEVELKRVEVDAVEAGTLPGLRPGGFACLSVRDNGQGMHPTTLQRIFEPFFTTKDLGKGTGLGLPVVHGILQAHDGAIRVTSQLGQGALFQLFFPAMAPEPDVEAPSHDEAPRGRGQRILYLDDEGPLVVIATRMFERLGYRVEGYTRPAEALHAFKAQPDEFDVVITDLHMPGVSGFDIAEELKKVRPDIHVILSSGHLTEDLVERARRCGIRHVLRKPNSIQELSQSVHQLLREVAAPDGLAVVGEQQP
ncbi:MAG TPA: ATP-binding protein [Candidatus Saccharimonadales bacterium]|nr:ATP-binding protein [Candidatus Saccharimonadales bacterium]